MDVGERRRRKKEEERRRRKKEGRGKKEEEGRRRKREGRGKKKEEREERRKEKRREEKRREERRRGGERVRRRLKNWRFTYSTAVVWQRKYDFRTELAEIYPHVDFEQDRRRNDQETLSSKVDDIS